MYPDLNNLIPFVMAVTIVNVINVKINVNVILFRLQFQRMQVPQSTNDMNLTFLALTNRSPNDFKKLASPD